MVKRRSPEAPPSNDPRRPPSGRASISPGAGLVTATERELVRLGALDTMLGQQALVIARGMANGSGSELATLSKEHSRLMANIAAGNKVTSDPLADADDAVEEKRRRAAGAASS